MDLHIVTYLVGSYRVLNFSDEDNDDMKMMVVAKANMGYLCDIEMIMGLICIMPLLKAMHTLIKFVQGQNSFVCEFVTFVKICCVELYNMYFNLEKKYNQEHFKAFFDLYQSTNDQLLIGWWIDHATNIYFVIFYFMNKQYQLHKKCHFTSLFTQAM